MHACTYVFTPKISIKEIPVHACIKLLLYKSTVIIHHYNTAHRQRQAENAVHMYQLHSFGSSPFDSVRGAVWLNGCPSREYPVIRSKIPGQCLLEYQRTPYRIPPLILSALDHYTNSQKEEKKINKRKSPPSLVCKQTHCALAISGRATYHTCIDVLRAAEPSITTSHLRLLV